MDYAETGYVADETYHAQYVSEVETEPLLEPVVFSELEQELFTGLASFLERNEPLTIVEQTKEVISAAEVADTMGEMDVKQHPVLGMPIVQRKHVIITGSTGDGKTQCEIRLMVEDIKRGAQVYWLSPHLTLYNEEDQPTDLRPLEHHFRQVFTYSEIGRQLQIFSAEAQRRLPFYRGNQPIGDTIVIYLDEWPGIVDMCGETATQALKTIAMEGRKVKVFLVIASQDTLVDTIGIKSGVRGQFETRLVGRVDSATWQAMIGSGVRRYTPARKGEWTYPRRDEVLQVHINPATPELIANVAQMPKRDFSMTEALEFIPDRTIENTNEVVSNVLRVIQFLAEDEAISNREIARRLWPESGDGGGRWGTKAGLLRDQAVTVLRGTAVPEGGTDGVPEPLEQRTSVPEDV